MGTTLENGVYLPSEGERNCYAGLKTNWEILDQKVADVTALQQAVAGALHREIVESLPTTDIDPNTIYMVLSGTSATENVYNEYMYVNNAWELIGTSATDLTNYYTKAEVDGKLLLKANDSDVVHKSGNETINGVKTITDTNLEFKSTSAEYGVSAGDSSVVFRDKNNLQTFKIYSKVFFSGIDNNLVSFFLTQKVDNTYYTSNGIQLLANTGNKDVILRPILANNNADGLSVSLGASDRRWSKIYGTEYYYGSNNVEFSTKFVTTDTNQTISGNKTFSDSLTIYNSDDTVTPKGLVIINAQWGMGESGGTTVSSIKFLDKNSTIPVSVIASKGLSGQSYLRFAVRTKDSQNTTYSEEIYYDIDTSGNVEFRSWHDNSISLGTSVYRWKDVQTYKVNNLEPSSLSLPSGNASDVIDISSYLVNFNGTANTYTAPANGWVSIAVDLCKEMMLSISGFIGCSATRTASGRLVACIPIAKNQQLSITIYSDGSGSTAFARFIPCQGNV